jgi:hypothetical protein
MPGEARLAIFDLNRLYLPDCSLIPIDVRQLQGEQIDQGRIRDLASPSERGKMQRAIDQMKDRCRQPVYELVGPFRYRSEDGAKASRRTCDDPQYLRCRRLALEGLSKLQFERIGSAM